MLNPPSDQPTPSMPLVESGEQASCGLPVSGGGFAASVKDLAVEVLTWPTPVSPRCHAGVVSCDTTRRVTADVGVSSNSQPQPVLKPQLPHV